MFFSKYMCWKKILDKCRPSARRVSCSRARPRDQEPPHSLETWDVQMASDDIRWPHMAPTKCEKPAVKHGKTSWSMVKPIVKPTDHDPQTGGWTHSSSTFWQLLQIPTRQWSTHGTWPCRCQEAARGADSQGRIGASDPVMYHRPVEPNHHQKPAKQSLT